MCADWSGPWGEDPEGEGSPDDSRPFGTRPFGTRPFGTRPFGTRPFGTRPFGTRPFGTRPFGTRPFGTRPFGTRPFGTRDDEGGGDATLDATEWTADITELFCLCSAVVRLGARVVVDKTEVPVVAVGDPAGPLAYLEQPKTTNPKEDEEGIPKESEEKPEARVSQRLLRPRDHELALKVILPNHLIRDLVDFPEVAAAVKEDIAYRLATHADGAFLGGGGAGTPEPLGVVNTLGVPSVAIAAVPDFLDTARTMIEVARRGQPPLPARPAYFGAAGWVLHPDTLAALTATRTDDFLVAGARRSLDSKGELLSYDGGDGGCLLGYPFIVSEGAGENGMVFSADWSEAWIGIDCDFVTVDISTDVNFQTDETVVRAVMHHDFVVRTPRSFVFAK